ncbi:hypothetical protein GRI97_03440 [Altererythrobacter xixiisoli]|uniref:PsbP C-terminal domain-containing protein n=1 Tax=Croceibacterium xixiisoli TaxID=1476466 RepID=A0A6I4TSD4_9SPHN|nr:hypothetical protein [Croceibacterium xixiisoli]MXO98041.1 hypothetical protein [Croceibacterium xixiisoli]
MYKWIAPALAAAALTFSAPGWAHKLMGAGERVEVARSGMALTPTTDWNKLSYRPGKFAERWTMDGEMLNDVIFYTVPANEPLLREVDKRNRPLPQFQANMLAVEIPQLLESTKRIANDVAIFTTTSSTPAKLGGVDGVKFTYQFVGTDELRRNGEAFAAISNGTLYMISYEAPEIHYFDKDLENYRKLVESVSIAG